MLSAIDESFIAIARILRPRGIRGEVLAELHTDHPDRFSGLKEVWLEFPDASRRSFILENFWLHQGRQVLKLGGVDSIDDAELLRGAWVQVEARDAVALPEGRYFDHELIGCRVRTLAGEEIGLVDSVLRIPGNHQLVVRSRDREVLIPAVESICTEVCLERRLIIVDPPEGLMDLNR